MSEPDPEMLLHGDTLFTEFKGALTEQFVQQELTAETAPPDVFKGGQDVSRQFALK